MKIFKLSKPNLWTLFLMTAFPTHVWTILLAFQDFSWMTARNNSWDAVGVGAYGLLAAFVESIFVFVVALLLSLLLPRSWDEKKRLAALTGLIFIVAIAEILNQLYFLNGLPPSIFAFLLHSGHPLRYLYGTTLVVSIAALALSLYFTATSKKFVDAAQNIIERLSLLTMLYLLLDFVGLVIVVVRNLS
ncbi:MAG: hypothetical protein HN413_15410 [Chloroflexi bacterium]|jgi:hypothetical protein|nr:hypothetical protein [Chloroflexota bacterium]